jgi:hypothetical protein
MADVVWQLSHRADPVAARLADRHYNRQKIGSPQFVPPGRCLVLRSPLGDAVWATSYPFAEFVKHRWAGAWVNSLFRNESSARASDLIRMAVAWTLTKWDPPALGIVSFVNPQCVRPTIRRGIAIYGYCYLRAGWTHVGYTQAGLWAWQQLPAAMPPAEEFILWP